MVVGLSSALALAASCSPDAGPEPASATVPTAAPSDQPTPPATATPSPAPTPPARPPSTEDPGFAPPPVAEAPAGISPTGPSGPYAIPTDPAALDEAYVQGVLTALDELFGAAVRAMLASRGDFSDPAFVQPLRAGYTESEFMVMVGVFDEWVEQGFPGVRSDPGPRRRVLSEIRYASPTCLEVVVARDLSEMVEELPSGHLEPDEFVALVPAGELDDVMGLNPTPWHIIWEELFDEEIPEGKCAP